MNNWFFLALPLALCTTLTVIFATVDIRGVDSDLATAIRTIAILALVWAIAFFRNKTGALANLTRRRWLFLLLSGVATGLFQTFYFRTLQAAKVSQVAPVAKLSVTLAIVLSVVFLGESISWETGIGAAFILPGNLIIARQ